jgi:hypothetical protein
LNGRRVRVNLNNLGVVEENALLTVHNGADAIGATRGVKADMVETNLEVRQLEVWNPIHLLKDNDIEDG